MVVNVWCADAVAGLACSWRWHFGSDCVFDHKHPAWQNAMLTCRSRYNLWNKTCLAATGLSAYCTTALSFYYWQELFSLLSCSSGMASYYEKSVIIMSCHTNAATKWLLCSVITANTVCLTDISFMLLLLCYRLVVIFSTRCHLSVSIVSSQHWLMWLLLLLTSSQPLPLLLLLLLYHALNRSWWCTRLSTWNVHITAVQQLMSAFFVVLHTDAEHWHHPTQPDMIQV